MTYYGIHRGYNIRFIVEADTAEGCYELASNKFQEEFGSAQPGLVEGLFSVEMDQSEVLEKWLDGLHSEAQLQTRKLFDSVQEWREYGDWDSIEIPIPEIVVNVEILSSSEVRFSDGFVSHWWKIVDRELLD